MPSALMRLISANSSSTRIGDSPSDGSSRMQQPRLRHQSAPDRQHLLLAAGQRAGALRAALGKPRENREHPVAVLLAVGAAAAIGAEIEVLAHRHVGKDAAAFRHVN